MFVKKWPLEYWEVIKTYLPTYLWGSSDICDSFDGFDSSDSSDSSNGSDKNFATKIWWPKFCDLTFVTKLCD